MTEHAHPLIEIPTRIDRLFLHYFDIHFLEEKGSAVDTKRFQQEMRSATRMAVASANKVFVPAASYFESAVCRSILDELDELVAAGTVVLVGSSSNLDVFIRERQDEGFYRKNSSQYQSYRTAVDLEKLPAYQTRHRSATRDIVDRWGLQVEAENLQKLLHDATGSCSAALELRLERVPEELAGLAFIPEYVFEVLEFSQDADLARARIRSVINEAYFHSYVQELHAGVVLDLSYLASDFKLPSYGRNLSFSKMARFILEKGWNKKFSELSQQQLIKLGTQSGWLQALQTEATYVQKTIGTSRRELTMQKDKEDWETTAATRTVLCVTAAIVEFKSTKRVFEKSFGPGQTVHLNEEKTEYGLEFSDAKSNSRWILVSSAFQGQVEAATHAARLSNLLSPEIFLMIGMCMGMPKRAYPVGTVIVPAEIFSFDHQRLAKDKPVQHRPHAERVANGLYMLARVVSSESHDYKVVTDKAVASASTKIEDTESTLVNLLEQSFPDIAAFDMEGGGFYRAGEGKKFLWIKAVADSGEPQETSSVGTDLKQSAQKEATENSADFAIKLGRSYFQTHQSASRK